MLLDRPIKTLGFHEVRISLHPEVDIKISVNVARTAEEAQRQARGEDVTMIRDRFEDEGEEESEEGAAAAAPETEMEEAAEGAESE